MEEWIELKLKKYAPLYKAAISNFNKQAYKRLIDLRNGIDKHNLNFSNIKISQRALSLIADILPQNYNRIEKGRINKGNNITLEQAIKLSIIYGCSIDYIATGKDFINTDTSTAIIEDLKNKLEQERKINRLLLDEMDRIGKKKK